MPALTRRSFTSTLAGAAASVAAAQQPRGPRWNLLIITNDQHRADCLACMGNPVVKTPHLDALASEGALFTRHFVQTPQCVPSRATMATGRYPHVHRTPSNAYMLPESEHTIAKLLNDAGYVTAAVGEPPFAPRSYTGGFSRNLADNSAYDKFLDAKGWSRSAKKSAYDEQARLSKERFQAAAAPWPAELDESFFFAEHARAFLRDNKDKPFFLHVNFRRPHHPFDPPAPYDRMYEGATFPPSHRRDGEMANKPPSHQQALKSSVGFDLTTMSQADLDRVKSFYYGMITLNDEAIGRILDELHAQGLDRNTVVVFNADHGEMLGDHGLLFKGAYMYDEVLRVPLIIRAPGKVEARKVDAFSEQVDILPTVLDLIGVPQPEGVQGTSLFGSTRRKPAVFAEFPTIKMVRTTDWKLVHYPTAKHGELYDLKKDPHELHNLWPDPAYSAQRADMLALLADWLIRTTDPKLAPVRDPSEPRA